MTGTTRRDGIGIIIDSLGKHLVAINQVLADVDDDIAVDVAAGIAAAIDVTAHQAAVHVIAACCSGADEVILAF